MSEKRELNNFEWSDIVYLLTETLKILDGGTTLKELQSLKKRVSKSKEVIIMYHTSQTIYLCKNFFLTYLFL